MAFNEENMTTISTTNKRGYSNLGYFSDDGVLVVSAPGYFNSYRQNISRGDLK